MRRTRHECRSHWCGSKPNTKSRRRHRWHQPSRPTGRGRNVWNFGCASEVAMSSASSERCRRVGLYPFCALPAPQKGAWAEGHPLLCRRSRVRRHWRLAEIEFQTLARQIPMREVTLVERLADDGNARCRDAVMPVEEAAADGAGLKTNARPNSGPVPDCQGEHRKAPRQVGNVGNRPHLRVRPRPCK